MPVEWRHLDDGLPASSALSARQYQGYLNVEASAGDNTVFANPLRVIVPVVSACLLLGCSANQEAGGIIHVFTPDVINLLVMEPAAHSNGSNARASSLGGTTGRITVQGECLILIAGQQEFTPVFVTTRSRVRIEENSIIVGDQVVLFNMEYAFPGAITERRINAEAFSECPETGVILPLIKQAEETSPAIPPLS